MCGRYAAKKNPALLAAEFDAIDQTGESAPRPDYNVAPTKAVATVVTRHPRDEEGAADPSRVERSIRVMRWGLVPHWAKDRSIGSRMINARADSAATKPAFKSSLARRRCLIPADGWFEWKREGKAKQPFYMTRRDDVSLAFAGIWSPWRDPNADADAEPLITCAVLTTDATGQLTEIHDRMPLMLPRDRWTTWLDPDNDDVSSLLTEPDQALIDSLELRPVADTVNNVRNNGPELIAEARPTVEIDNLFPELSDKK